MRWLNSARAFFVGKSSRVSIQSDALMRGCVRQSEREKLDFSLINFWFSFSEGSFHGKLFAIIDCESARLEQCHHERDFHHGRQASVARFSASINFHGFSSLFRCCGALACVGWKKAVGCAPKSSPPSVLVPSFTRGKIFFSHFLLPHPKGKLFLVFRQQWQLHLMRCLDSATSLGSVTSLTRFSFALALRTSFLVELTFP